MIGKFSAMDRAIGQKLSDFISRKNIDKSVDINGEIYKLIYISHNTNAFFRSRGLSAYFRVKNSIVRISDHWGKSEGFDRSRKLNCISISGKNWQLVGKTEKVYCSWNAGKYPFEMLAGKISLANIRKTCDHF